MPPSTVVIKFNELSATGDNEDEFPELRRGSFREADGRWLKYEIPGQVASFIGV